MEQAIHDRLKALSSAASSTSKGLFTAPDSAATTADVDITTMEELILDGRKFQEITIVDAQLLKQFRSLNKLSCNRTGLTNLDGFPPMPNVKCLELTDNHLGGKFDIIPKMFSNLKRLELGGNHIKSIDELYTLSELTSLQSLGLEMNPIADTPNYRQIVFSALPQLEILDRIDKHGNEHEDDDFDEDGEEEEGEEDTTLKDFYEMDYSEAEEEVDADFDPGVEDDESEEIEDDDDESMGDEETAAQK